MTEIVEKDLVHPAALESSTSLQYKLLRENKRAYMNIKRTADVVISATMLLVLAIPMLLIAAMIAIDSRGPVFFQQKRVGRYGKIFRCLKFRTMRMDAPKYCSTEELKHPEQYVTRIGRILRKTSLDELPQLINVLRGDMSLIGPRPLIPEEVEVHRLREHYGVYAILPGITGWAQVNGRDFLSVKDKARMDFFYMRHMSLELDMLILARSVHKVVACKDVYEGGRH